MKMSPATLSSLWFCLYFIVPGCQGDCQPGFADSCLSRMDNEFSKIVDIDGNAVKNDTDEALRDFCKTIDETLTCTSDIIDGDCSEEEGKQTFDSWVVYLRGAYNFVCTGSMEKFRAILTNLLCWNIQTFIECMETTVGINHVRSLLENKLDKSECSKLRGAFSFCTAQATTSSCREMEETVADVKQMFDAFLQDSPCKDSAHKNTSVSAVLSTGLLVLLLLCTFLV